MLIRKAFEPPLRETTLKLRPAWGCVTGRAALRAASLIPTYCDMNARVDAKKQLDARLDEALEGTFPASDPVSIGAETGTEPSARPMDRTAPRLILAGAEKKRAKRRRGSRRSHG